MHFGVSFESYRKVQVDGLEIIIYEKDKSFRAENIRQAFNQVKVLIGNDYGSGGGFAGLEVQVMRTQKIEESYKAIENSIKVFRILEEKAKAFNEDLKNDLVVKRDYETLEMHVLELLMKG